MLLNVTEYYRPETVEDALRLLRRPGIKTAPLAGGTLLVGQRDDELQAVVDLQALGLNTISEQDGQVHLGAMVTLQALVDSSMIQALAGGVLAQAAKSSAARLIRNAATIGGTLAAGPAANADLAVALAALGAQAQLVGETRRLVPAQAVFEERPPAEAEGAFLRVARTPDDVALVHVAAVLLVRGGICRHLTVAVGGADMSP